MKKLVIFLFFLTSSDIYALDINLEKIVDGLKKPWSLSFIDQQNIVFTEKQGKLYKLNLKNKEILEIKHNLSVFEVGLGGLLDVLYDDEQIYISYSE